MNFKHGQRVMGVVGNSIVSGYFIGAYRYMDGEVMGVIQPMPDSHQVFLVALNKIKERVPLEPSPGTVVIRDRSNEPAERELPPFKTSKY